MATLILARHGRTAANAQRILAGRTAGIGLDETGRDQVTRAAARLAEVDLAAAVTSPLQRCKETARILLHGRGLRARVETGLTECDYGTWTGRPMADLVREPLWKVVLAHPSAVEFPGGETMNAMASRAVRAVRAADRRVEAEHGAEAVWLAVSHGDVIKAVLADALGMHLDAFQRIVVDPASLSVIRFTERRAFVLTMNSHAGPLAALARPTAERPEETLGGGAGPQDAPAATGGPAKRRGSRAAQSATP